MRSDNKNSGTAPLIVTIATAAVAVAAVVILLVVMGGRDSGNDSSSAEVSGFSATSGLYDECTNAAKELVSANYEVIRLFVTEGLPPETVYEGKVPEPIEGYYVTKSEKYTGYSQIEALVKQVYTDDAAGKILTGENGVKIYEDRTIHGDTFLGMNAEFSPDEDYKTDWSNCVVEVEPLSADKCTVTVYVDGVSPESAEGSPESVLKTEMIRTDGGWRLAEFLR